MLPEGGASCTDERKRLVRRFLKILPAGRLQVIIGDREFVGADWLAFLEDQGVPFLMRIRKNIALSLEADGPKLPAEMFFRGRCSSPRRIERYIGEVRVHVIGQQLDETGDEFIIVVTNARPAGALKRYQQRWEIETLFAALKSRGFELEETHLRSPERLAKLIGLLALGFVWSHLVGEWRHRHERPLKPKSHGRLEKSLFRYGLDYLQECLLNFPARREAFHRLLQALANPRQFLSCT